MHNQRRDDYKNRFRDEKIASVLAKKANKWHTVMGDLLNRRDDMNGSIDGTNSNEQTLEIISNMLKVNPDPLQLWNHRRVILLDQSPLNKSSFLLQEQKLTQAALERNPKAYGAWFHRKWSIRYHLLHYSKDNNYEMLQKELGLCAEFLSLDERNFHCWHYRRFIVAALAHVLTENSSNNDTDSGVSGKELDSSWAWCDDLHELLGGDFPKIGSQIVPSKPKTADNRSSGKLADKSRQNLLLTEWDFTTEKIKKNFSNGSAFHYRSKLLPLIHARSSLRREEIVREELQFTHNATFTEPDDQTAWWYHRFLLSWANPFNGSDGKVNEESVTEYKSILLEEYEEIEGLVVEEEGQCKWGILGLLQICQELRKVGSKEKDEYLNEHLAKLQAIDPDRSNRYRSMVE